MKSEPVASGLPSTPAAPGLTPPELDAQVHPPGWAVPVGRRIALALAASAVPLAVAAGLGLHGGPLEALAGVEVAGCEEVLAGGGCAVGPRTRLVIWAPVAPGAEVRAPAGARQQRLPGGVQLVVSAPDPRQAIALEVRQAGRRWRWQLDLVAAQPHPALQAAIARLAAGDGPGAASLVDRAWPALNDRQRALGLALRAEVAQARGEVGRWFDLRGQAAEQAARSGARLSAARYHLALAHGHLTRRHDLAAARARLEQAAALQVSGMAALWQDMQRGYLAQRSGDLAGALAAFASSAARAERLDQPLDVWLARRQEAAMLGALGRFEEALAAFRALAGAAAGRAPCERAGFLSSLAWQEAMAREAGTSPAVAGSVHGTIARAEQALALYRGACPTAGGQLANAAVNLALAHLQAGQVGPARESLAAAGAGEQPPQTFIELWRIDLEGRAALAAGEPAAALAAYQRLEELAARTLAGEARWRAAVGRARARALQGQRMEAIAAYQEAEALLDDQINQVPLGEGRSDFLGARDLATGELIAALQAAGRTVEAIEVARRGRGRTLVGLRPRDLLHARLHDGARALDPALRRSWERAAGAFLAARARLEALAERRWSLPGSELAAARASEQQIAREARQELAAALARLAPAAQRAPLSPPGPGEAILGFHPASRGPAGPTTWQGYLISEGATELVQLGPVDPAAPPAELAARLLRPFGPPLAAARRVRVLGYGPLSGVDFHALPFQGEPLGSRRQVVYSLDLPPSPSRPAVPGPAVVVADPGGDLPGARREGAEVVALLRARGATRVLEAVGLQGELSAARVRPLLAGADLFHYAGHGRFAAPDGMGSELPLAGGTALAVADVLALSADAVPRTVVLSGCETGRSQRQAGAELGLAHAFVLAGSEAVVASVREVGDGVARELATRLHRSDLADLGEALRLAQRSLARDRPDADWAAFRVIVR